MKPDKEWVAWTTIGFLVILLTGFTCFFLQEQSQKEAEEAAIANQIFKDNWFKECLKEKKQYECDALYRAAGWK